MGALGRHSIQFAFECGFEDRPGLLWRGDSRGRMRFLDDEDFWSLVCRVPGVLGKRVISRLKPGETCVFPPACLPAISAMISTTTTEYIGLAPHGTVEGERIYVVLGASVPYVPRVTTAVCA